MKLLHFLLSANLKQKNPLRERFGIDRLKILGLLAVLYSFVKPEKLRIRIKLNHFAIKGKIYIEAFKITYDNPEKMSGTQNRLALV